MGFPSLPSFKSRASFNSLGRKQMFGTLNLIQLFKSANENIPASTTGMFVWVNRIRMPSEGVATRSTLEAEFVINFIAVAGCNLMQRANNHE